MNKVMATLLMAALAGCAVEGGKTGERPFRDIETGALLGAVGGAVIGAVAYKKNRTKGAFAVNSADIRPAFRSTMDKVSDVVIRYGKTTLVVVGHTDDTGSNDYNQKLSERRAHSVAEYFDAKNVNPLRLAVSGKGETQPVSSNRTEAGRELNRRVEIYVEPVVDG